MHAQQGFAPTTLGERLRLRDRGWFAVTEARHRPGERLRPHAHRYPAITVVRQGSFGLRIGSETVDCSTRGVYFKRGEHRHENEVGHAGSRSLILELRTDSSRLEDGDVPLPDASFWTGDAVTRRLADGIAREFDTPDRASDLALEGLVLELLARLLRRRVDPTDTSRPGWLSRVEDMLREQFRESIALRDVATAVARHPAHLARTFRRHHGCSVGEFLRRIRLEHAALGLRGSDRPLSEIAMEVGFYDQAHFGRCFRSWMGTTPRAYRASHRSR
jgi:AraC family transcriptional regulator